MPLTVAPREASGSVFSVHYLYEAGTSSNIPLQLSQDAPLSCSARYVLQAPHHLERALLTLKLGTES